MLNSLSIYVENQILRILETKKDCTKIKKDNLQNLQVYTDKFRQYDFVIINTEIQIQQEFQDKIIFVNYNTSVFDIDAITRSQQFEIFNIILNSDFTIDNILYYQFVEILNIVVHSKENFDSVKFAQNFIKNLDYFLITNEYSKEKIGVYRIDVHPCHIKTHNNSKMGLSLFSVLGKQMQTSKGKKYLLKILNKPLKNLIGIKRRQKLFEIFLNLNLMEKNKIKETLNKYKFYQNMINKIGNEDINRAFVKDLYQNLNLTFEFFNFLQILLQKDFILANNKIVTKTISEIQKIFDTFIQIQSNELQFNLEVDQEYTNLLQVKENLQYYLDHVKNKESDRIQNFSEYIQQFQLLLIPEVGYFFSIVFVQEFLTSLNFNENDQQIYEAKFWKIFPEDYKYTFSKNEIFFFKSQTSLQLEKDIGEINCKIFEKEQLFMIEICKQITQNREFFQLIDTQISLIDCFCGLVYISYQHRLQKPMFIENQNIFIAKNLKDIVKESINQNFLPYNFYSVPFKNFQDMKNYDIDTKQSSNLFNILTGPNNSGKTSFLKTLSRSIYLAHCGIFTPAEELILSVFDCIEFLTGFQESNLNLLSGQDQSVKKLDHIIDKIETQKACIFFDEFLNNFSPQFRAKVFQSFHKYLENLYAQDKLKSLIFYSTHDLKLLKKNIINCTEATQLFYMNYIYEEQNEKKNLLFLYELKKGISESSFAKNIFYEYFEKEKENEFNFDE